MTPKKRGEFLDYLRDGWSVTASAGKIGVSRQAVYALKQADVEFAGEWEDAYESGTDVYEDEAKRRAIEGTERPVFYQGEIVGHIREYSDTLLIVALKARRPEKYRDNIKQEITGKDGGPIETSDASLTDEQRAGRIAAILDAARARRDGQTVGS